MEFIQEKYITTEETLDLLCRMLPQSGLVRGSVVAFDGFTGFTPIQNRLIQRIMGLAKEVIVTAVMDGGEKNPYKPSGEQQLFYLSKKTVADLRRLAKEESVPWGKDVFIRPEELPRFLGNKEMQHLENICSAIHSGRMRGIMRQCICWKLPLPGKRCGRFALKCGN